MPAERATVSSTRETMTMTVGEFLLRRIREPASGTRSAPGRLRARAAAATAGHRHAGVGRDGKRDERVVRVGRLRAAERQGRFDRDVPLGPLSPTNGIACSYAEPVPLIYVC